jgi:hypothetical protein
MSLEHFRKIKDSEEKKDKMKDKFFEFIGYPCYKFNRSAKENYFKEWAPTQLFLLAIEYYKSNPKD